jgi:peptidoglycan hydrolase CwlO-like protein
MKRILISGAAALVLLGMIATTSRAQSLTTTEEGVIGGAALGAGTGAVVGAGVHHAGKGALIGAGLGAVTGGVVGHELQNQQDAQRRLQGEVSAQQRQIDRQRAEIEELKQDQPVSPDGQQANEHLQETE